MTEVLWEGNPPLSGLQFIMQILEQVEQDKKALEAIVGTVQREVEAIVGTVHREVEAIVGTVQREVEAIVGTVQREVKEVKTMKEKESYVQTWKDNVHRYK